MGCGGGHKQYVYVRMIWYGVVWYGVVWYGVLLLLQLKKA